MTWQPIETAPRDGSPILYWWADHVVSTCIWLEDGGCWWDLRAEEPAWPQQWAAIG
jgi:hypothetical protein